MKRSRTEIKPSRKLLSYTPFCELAAAGSLGVWLLLSVNRLQSPQPGPSPLTADATSSPAALVRNWASSYTWSAVILTLLQHEAFSATRLWQPAMWLQEGLIRNIMTQTPKKQLLYLKFWWSGARFSFLHFQMGRIVTQACKFGDCYTWF